MGIDTEGNYLLLDTGNFTNPRLYLDIKEFEPLGLDEIGYKAPARPFLAHSERDLHVSRHMVDFYTHLRRIKLGHVKKAA